MPKTNEEVNNTSDKYRGVEVALHDARGYKLMARVLRRTYDYDRNGSGAYNPLKDNSTYEVKIPYGHVQELPTKANTENMMLMCDLEGRHCKLIDEIRDHRKSEKALTMTVVFVKIRSGRKVPKKAKVGW